MLRVNFPLVSSVCSFFNDSTPKIFIFPALDPEMMSLSSGENAIVQTSTGPDDMLPMLAPVSKSHSFIVESKELDAQTGNK